MVAVSDQKFRSAIGLALRVFRKEKHLTMREVAASLGLELGTVARREKGAISMSVHELIRYSVVYGVSPSAIVERAEQLARAMPN